MLHKILDIRTYAKLVQPLYISNCAGITAGAAYDCDNPLRPGVNARMILLNLDEIATVTFDGTTPSIITNIAMSSGNAGYAFDGFRISNNPQYAMILGTVDVGYDHQVDFHVFDISQVQKDNLEAMAKSRVVAVVEYLNWAGNGDTFFEVYGLNLGLEMQTNVRIPGDLETLGAFAISLKTSDDDGGKEPKMPQTWFDTDYATTKAAVDALLTPVP